MWFEEPLDLSLTLTHRPTGTRSSSSGCGSISSSLECVRLKHAAGDPVKTGVCEQSSECVWRQGVCEKLEEAGESH